MSKVFGTIAAVFLAASAFIALKNQDAYKRELKALDGEQREEASTKTDLAKQQKRLVDAEGLKDTYLSDAAKVQTELDAATVQLDAAKKAVTALKDSHKDNEAEIANADEIMKGLPNPDELVPKVKRMRGELAQSTSGIATEEARLANLIRQDRSGKTRIAGLRETIDAYSTGNSLKSLKTSIRSVYRNWGFVILAAGDRSGVVSGSTLDVFRGGEVIGKLKVTAVEAGRASADIVLDSVAVGTTLQPGDTVKAERKAEVPAAATAATAQQ